MHPADINAALVKAGTNQTRLERELGVSQSLVSRVISGQMRSARVAKAIARATRLPLGQLWPSVYGADRRCTSRPA